MNLHSQRAFTLVELLIAIALIMIVASLAAPSLGQLRQKHQLQAFQAELQRLITHARHQAMVSHRRVTICAMDQQGRCVSLKKGLLTSFIDSNGNRMLDAQESVLQTLAIPSHIKGNWRGMQPIHSLHFSNLGYTFVSNGTFTLCHEGGLEQYRQLALNKQGRVQPTSHLAPCPLDD